MPVRNFVVNLLEIYERRMLRRRFKKFGLKTVAQIDDILNRAGVKYYLEFGGLLGWVRENRFLPWDYDLDFGVLVESCDTISKLRKAFVDAGFKWQKQYIDERGKDAEDAYVINGLVCDFFFCERDDDGWRHSGFSITEDGIYDTKRNVTTVYYHEPQELKREVIGGISTWFPVDCERALSERYGANWRTPDPEWAKNDKQEYKRLVRHGPVGKFIAH